MRRRTMRPGRSAGMTLVELMIAMLLAAMVSTGILWMIRTQLIAYQLNDQLTVAQQNLRAGTDFIEQMMRRSCSGAANGMIGVNVPGVPQSVIPCVRVWDGANLVGNGFATGSALTLPDAFDVVYATGAAITACTIAPSLATANPSAQVVSIAGFNVGDLVLLSDWNNAALFKISAIAAAGGGGTGGTLTFGGLGGAPILPPGLVPTTGTVVLQAATASLYVATTPPYTGMLMLDPDGVAGTVAHGNAQPVVDGVVDFQLAAGFDKDGNGIVTDNPNEWLGSSVGDVLPPPPWNVVGTPASPQARQLRATLVTRTSSTFAGTAATAALTQNEDRTTFPNYAFRPPRFRAMRIRVAPRVWNLSQ